MYTISLLDSYNWNISWFLFDVWCIDVSRKQLLRTRAFITENLWCIKDMVYAFMYSCCICMLFLCVWSMQLLMYRSIQSKFEFLTLKLTIRWRSIRTGKHRSLQQFSSSLLCEKVCSYLEHGLPMIFLHILTFFEQNKLIRHILNGSW